MSHDDYIETKTKENIRVVFRKDQIGAIEDIPGSARTEPYIKVYSSGYSFNLSDEFDEFVAKVQGTNNKED